MFRTCFSKVTIGYYPSGGLSPAGRAGLVDLDEMREFIEAQDMDKGGPAEGRRLVARCARGQSEQGARLAQKMQVGPCIPVGIQPQNAEVGPTSGPAWSLSRSVPTRGPPRGGPTPRRAGPGRTRRSRRGCWQTARRRWRSSALMAPGRAQTWSSSVRPFPSPNPACEAAPSLHKVHALPASRVCGALAQQPSRVWLRAARREHA
jgi:hypothetical protein